MTSNGAGGETLGIPRFLEIRATSLVSVMKAAILMAALHLGHTSRSSTSRRRLRLWRGKHKFFLVRRSFSEGGSISAAQALEALRIWWGSKVRGGVTVVPWQVELELSSAFLSLDIVMSKHHSIWWFVPTFVPT
jgi:hypothetical protein